MSVHAFPGGHITPSFPSLRRCVLRQGPPDRVHVIELHQDEAAKAEVAARFGLARGLDPADPLFALRRDVEVQRFLGYDLVRIHAPESEFRVDLNLDDPNAGFERTPQGYVVHEHAGPIQTAEHLERYPWPDAARIDSRPFAWAEEHLPEGMAGYDLAMQVFEACTWLMGYESLFLNMARQPGLVEALVERVGQAALAHVEFLCQFDRIGVIFGCDDMGHRTGPLVSPQWLRERILPWHRRAAAIAHAHGKLYFLHSCGNVEALLPDFVRDVGIDAKHSFEDTVLPVTEFHRLHHHEVATLGGIDLDFLCRSGETAIRRRVRETLDACMPLGGYVLGSGNSIASYCPVDSWLTMLDEGHRWGG